MQLVIETGTTTVNYYVKYNVLKFNDWIDDATMLVPCTRYQKSQKLFYLFVGTPTNRAMAFQDPLQESHIRHAKVATIKFSLHVGFTRVVVMCTDRFVETMVHTNIDGVTCNDCLIKHWGQNSLHMGAIQPILNEVEYSHLYFNIFFRSSLPTDISIRKSSNRNEGRDNP